jgi:hypothetical protein
MGTCTRLAEHAIVAAFALTLAAAALAAEEEAPRDDGEKADTLGTPEPEAEVKGPNRGKWSFTVGNDFTTAYFFRGILQERNGFIYEPYLESALNLYEGDGPVTSVSAGLGLWFSLQTEKTFASGSGPGNLYEMDVYPSLTVGWQGGLETTVTYLWYTSPNGAFDTIQEVTLGLTYDDSELLGPFAIGPTATFGFETGNSVLGTTKGGYFELAGGPSIELSLPLDDDHKYPVTTTFPLAVGLSLYDYYADGNSNQTFGFFSFGVNAGIPLAFIPEDYGAWSVNAGINVLVLSQTLKNINLGDGAYPVGTLSLNLTY